VGGQQHGVAQAHFIREIKVLIQGEVQIRIYDAHRFLRLGGRGFDQRGHKSTLGSFVCCNTAKTTVWGAPVPEIKKSRSTNSRTSTAVLSGIGGVPQVSGRCGERLLVGAYSGLGGAVSRVLLASL